MRSIFNKTVSAVMLITVTGKILGLLRDRMQAVRFGQDTAEAVAFMQASTLPRIFLDMMFASVFSASFIPVFNDYLEKKGKQAAFDIAALFITVILILTGVFTLLCVIAAPGLYGMFLDGPAITAETRALGVVLLRIMLPLIVLSGLAFSLTGILQSLGEFNLPAAMSVASNGVIIIYYFFFIDRFGVVGLSIAFLIGWAAQSLIQVPFLVKSRFRFRVRLNLRDPGLKQIAVLTLPVIAASWVGPVNLAVNGKAAAALQTGGYAALHFAYNLFTIISGVFVLSVANIIFPKLSKQTASKDGEGFAETMGDTLRGLAFILLPMTLGIIAVSEPLIRLIYQGGLFQDSAVGLTKTALLYFAPGIPGYGVQVILSRAFYARFDGKTPLRAAVFAIAINAVLSFTLLKPLGIAGPALASSVSITAAALYMLIIAARRGYIRVSGPMLFDLLKMALMAVLMFVCVIFLRDVLTARASAGLLSRLLTLGLPVSLGALVYIGGCFLLKIDIRG